MVTVRADGERHRCRVTEVRWSGSRKDWEFRLDLVEAKKPYKEGEWVKKDQMKLAIPGPNHPLYQQKQDDKESRQDQRNQESQQSEQ